MLAIITLVAPVFGLIAIGWGAARIRYVPEAAGPLLSEFAYKLLLPALLFRAMATMAPPAQSPWLLAGTYATAVLLVWLTATLATLILLRRPAADAPAIAFATTFGNGLMLGIPLILSAFGPEAATPVAILVTCDSILLWMLGTLHMELALRGFGGGSLMQVARTVLHLVRNPIIAAVIIGTLWRWSGLVLPGVVDKLITLLAGAAIPVSRTALGMSLARYEIKGQTPTLLLITVLKLVAFPAVVLWLGMFVAGLTPVWAGALAVFSSMPVGANAFVFAARYERAVGSVSAAVAVTTVIAVLTVTAMLVILQALGLPVRV
ncbi:MAG: AEC family transporter [Hyphomicrobium sp.]|nr:AEC family transporter [Hyphomicrobium sp.]